MPLTFTKLIFQYHRYISSIEPFQENESVEYKFQNEKFHVSGKMFEDLLSPITKHGYMG